MSKRLKAVLDFNGDPVPSFAGLRVNLTFPHDKSGIVSAGNAIPRLIINTDAHSGDELPAALIQGAVDIDDVSTLVLTEDLPTGETLTLTFEGVVVENGRLHTTLDGSLAMDFPATANALSSGDATFTSEREYL